MNQDTRFKIIVLESLKHLLKNQERPSFKELDKMHLINTEINTQLKELNSEELKNDNIPSNGSIRNVPEITGQQKIRKSKTRSMGNIK